MKRSILCALLIAGLVIGFSSPNAEAQELLLDYVGYDYEFPDPDTTVFGELGSGYVGLGFVPVIFSPLVADMVNNEYTYHLFGLTSGLVSVFGDFVVIDYSGPGTIRVYEDALLGGTAADYGINPPNAAAPATFSDGTLILEGTITTFQVILNTVSNSGSYEAVFEATGGSQIGNIPVNQREGWTFAGLTGNELNMPEGYEHQVDGQIFLNPPVAVESTTWGRIKRTFR